MLSIVFGALVAVFSLVGILGNRGGGFRPDGISSRAWERYLDQIGTVSIALSALMLAMSIALIVIGTGQRRYKRWATKATMMWSAAALLFLVVQLIVNLTVMGPAMERVFADLGNSMVRDTALRFVKIGMFMSLVMYAPYPIVMLVAFRKPATVAAMDQD